MMSERPLVTRDASGRSMFEGEQTAGVRSPFGHALGVSALERVHQRTSRRHCRPGWSMVVRRPESASERRRGRPPTCLAPAISFGARGSFLPSCNARAVELVHPQTDVAVAETWRVRGAGLLGQVPECSAEVWELEPTGLWTPCQCRGVAGRPDDLNRPRMRDARGRFTRVAPLASA